MYPLTSEQKGDYAAGLKFASDLFRAFKQKNIDEGINGAQALWLHHRMRALDVSYPGATPMTVDIMNMSLSGDIVTSCLALIYCTPDDMSQTWHWFSSERKSWLIAQMKQFLGWP